MRKNSVLVSLEESEAELVLVLCFSGSSTFLASRSLTILFVVSKVLLIVCSTLASWVMY